MKDLARIVTKDRFINAYNICREYCENNENILDVNFRLIKKHLLELSEQKITTFYEKYIETELIYSFPEFHSCERVTIPKNSTGTREYRFFSTFSMILYNAIGLNIVDTCNDTIDSLQFNEKKIYPFYPTKFLLTNENRTEKNKWKVSNDYKTEYKKYQKRLNDLTSDNCAILQLDITQYFESIIHEKLINLVYKYANKSVLAKNNLDTDSYQSLEFYFESLMLKRFSIPQGRKNFVSDYFGYFYLIPFDMTVESLCSEFNLNFKGMIRYVDDITLVFENPNKLDFKEVYRELLVLESKIINWFLNELGLNINPSKTTRKYIQSEEEKKSFIDSNKKSTSGIELIEDVVKPNVEIKESKKGEKEIFFIEDKFDEFNVLLEKFNFFNETNFELKIDKNDRENLKLIYNENFQKFLLKKEISNKLIKTLENVEIELTVDFINMLIVLFLIKNKKGEFIYRKPIDKFLKINFNPSDKRHIHILHIFLAQKELDLSIVFENILKEKEKLQKDSYGKYLLTFANYKSEINCFSHLNDKVCFFQRLTNEFNSPQTQSHNQYLYHSEDKYQELLKLLISKNVSNKSITEQLKNYTLYKRIGKWDLSFNHFHNFFHEICKLIIGLPDSSTVKNITSHKSFSLEDQLTINKFYSRRNFNSISHPSQNEMPSEKVDKKDLLIFEKEVILILIKLLNFKNEDKPTT